MLSISGSTLKHLFRAKFGLTLERLAAMKNEKMDSISGAVLGAVLGAVPLGVGINLIKRKKSLLVGVVVRDPPRMPLESLQRFTWC